MGSCLGAGSKVGGKGKKRDAIGKKSASEANRAVFPSPDYSSSRFARRFFSPFPPKSGA